MRPEIDERNIDRLREWAYGRGKTYRSEKIGKKAIKTYTVNDCLDDLLKEAGF